MNDALTPVDPAFLGPGRFIEIDDPEVVDFARDVVGREKSEVRRAIRMFYAVRDGILYDAYLPLADPKSYSAREALELGRGWCVSKAALLTACARSQGIPARPGYADVRNHMATKKLLDAMGCDIFFWHSYCELRLGGKWVKCTPAFNKSLCDKFGLKPLEFDGVTDSLFHPFDKAGNRHMEYVNDRGAYADVPFDEILATFRANYRHMQDGIEGDFMAEAGRD